MAATPGAACLAWFATELEVCPGGIEATAARLTDLEQARAETGDAIRTLQQTA